MGLLCFDLCLPDQRTVAQSCVIARFVCAVDDVARRAGSTHTVANGVKGGEGTPSVAGWVGVLQTVSSEGLLQVCETVIP